jgi:hypothetical protein
MPSAEFKPSIPAIKRLQIYLLDHTATWFGSGLDHVDIQYDCQDGRWLRARSVHTQEKTAPQQMPAHTSFATGIPTFDPCIREVQNLWFRNVYRTVTVIGVLFSVSIKNYYCISGILAVVHFGLFLFSRLLAANSEIKIRKIVSLSFVLDGFKTQSLSRKTEGNNWWRAYMRDKDGARALEFINYCIFFT